MPDRSKSIFQTPKIKIYYRLKIKVNVQTNRTTGLAVIQRETTWSKQMRVAVQENKTMQENTQYQKYEIQSVSSKAQNKDNAGNHSPRASLKQCNINERNT